MHSTTLLCVKKYIKMSLIPSSSLHDFASAHEPLCSICYDLCTKQKQKVNRIRNKLFKYSVYQSSKYQILKYKTVNKMIRPNAKLGATSLYISNCYKQYILPKTYQVKPQTSKYYNWGWIYRNKQIHTVAIEFCTLFGSRRRLGRLFMC